MSNLYYDSINSNPDHKIVIYRSGGVGDQAKSSEVLIEGVMEHDMEMGSGAEWVSAFQSASNSLASLNQIFQTIGSASGRAVPTFRSPFLSRVRWDGSSHVTFPVTLTFINTGDGFNKVVRPIMRVVAATYPSTQKTTLRGIGKSAGLSDDQVNTVFDAVNSGINEVRTAVNKNLNTRIGQTTIQDKEFTLFIPPGAKNIGGKTRTLKMTWGRWLSVPNLVMQSATPTFSKEIDLEGAPLWGRIVMELQTIEVPTEKEILSWMNT